MSIVTHQKFPTAANTFPLTRCAIFSSPPAAYDCPRVTSHPTPPPQVKTLAGQENAVSELVRIVRVSEADKSVLKAALGSLAVLSSDDRNLKKMMAEGCAHA